MHDAETERVLDGHDEEVVETAAVAEPMLGQGDQVDVAVDGDGDAEPGMQLRPERRGRVRGRAGCGGSTPEARSTTPGMPTQRPLTSSIRSPASSTQRRTPSSMRSGITEAGCRSTRIGIDTLVRMSAWKFVTAIVIWFGDELDAAQRRPLPG